VENQVSASLSQEDIDAIMAAVQTIKDKLPFLIALTPEESRSLPRLGDKSRAFVSKAVELANSRSEILPGVFDLEEMRQDLELFEALYPIQMALTQIQELIADTTAVAGSEAYTAARMVYNFARNTGMNGELEPFIEDLSKRYRRGRRSNSHAAN